MKSIAIITARGGSKRIPGKNIKEFCGKPIIAYSIRAALDCKVFDTVMVSTDSMEIAEIARQHGAEIPFFRSDKTSDDYATTVDVLIEVLGKYAEQNISFDSLCCIYPTAPFVTKDKLKQAMKIVRSDRADAVIPVVQYGFPPQRSMLIRNGKLEYQFPENAQKRSQDLEAIYHDCGQFYACKVETLLQYRNLVTPNTVPMIMTEEEVQDIDNLSDWRLAEMKYRALY